MRKKENKISVFSIYNPWSNSQEFDLRLTLVVTPLIF